MIDKRNMYIFTDGGCRRSKELASFSSVTILGDIHNENVFESLSLNRGYKGATNNQMELSGFIATAVALFLKLDGFSTSENPSFFNKITVVSDSQYLVKGVNEYLPNWQENGYKTASKKTIKNKDLWHLIERIIDLYPNTEFEFVWTKGHEDLLEDEMDFATKYNNICDENCNRIMDLMENNIYNNDHDFDKFVRAISRNVSRLEARSEIYVQ